VAAAISTAAESDLGFAKTRVKETGMRQQGTGRRAILAGGAALATTGIIRPREARAAGTPMGHDAFHESYIRFVELITKRELGGIRLIAAK